MKLRIIFSIIINVLFILTASAQKTLRGKVFDTKTNTPLSGASIKFQGKGGTTTDKNGMFSIDCGKVREITVSYIGFESAKKSIINCDQDLNIGLVTSSNNLNEIDITATSNLNKEILYQPSSITKLTTPELKRGTGLFLDDAINGNVPGVIMTRRAVSSGQQF